MPTAKGKGGSTPHRYRPASEYDDATLAQKREYWRTKKREQRARLSERRGKTSPDNGGEKLLRLNTTSALNSSLSSSFAGPCSPVQSNDESYKTSSIPPAARSGNTAGGSSLEAAEGQKEKWFHTMSLNKVLPQFPAPCSTSAKSAGGNAAIVKSRTARGTVNRAVTSATLGGPQLNTTSSVPPVRVTTITNGSSANTPQPCVSMQDTSVPTMQPKAQVASHTQPKLLPTNVTTGVVLVSSPCDSVSIKTEDEMTNAATQSGTKSALVSTHRDKPSTETEEERAAKRREHWRIKKREQRAKLAARIGRVRERMQAGGEVMLQRQMAQKPGLIGGSLFHDPPPQSLLKGAGQRQCLARIKTSFTSVKRENNKLQSKAASLPAVNLQVKQIKVHSAQENRMTQTAAAPDVSSVKKTGESQRKLPSYVHLSNFTRGIARCKTPRQRFIDAQKNFMIQRNIRCKSPLLASVFGSRNIPRIDPNDTPEQIIAKRREYWRIKKREQRAKLSMEVKARLKEKDSLMRRVKRYQKILEEMRRARALTQSAGSTLTHASETIGGFIKEDGTVTVNIPQASTGHTAVKKTEEELHIGSTDTPITQAQHHPNLKSRGTALVRLNQFTAPPRSAQVKVSFPASVSKPPRLLSVRPRTQLESTTAQNSLTIPTQTGGQLTLTHPQSSQNSVSGGSTAGLDLGGCVMKMAVSSSAPSLSVLTLDPDLTEEERMAKKREYWRIKKREQRAARAARLKQGVLQARANAALQRRKARKQAAGTTVPLSRSLSNHTGNAQPLPNNSGAVTLTTNEIKQETESVPTVDLNSQPEQAICPDIKPLASPAPPAALQPESDPALSADSQATTLLAVASMKKLLEESLSTVKECNSEQPDVKAETKEEAAEQEMSPDLSQLFFEKDCVAPLAADLTLQIKSWPDADSLSPHLKDSPEMSETPPPLPTCTDVILHPTCENSSQTSASFQTESSVEDSPKAQRLRAKKAGHQSCCSPEPPKLHHLPIMDPLHPQKQHPEPQRQAQEQHQNNDSASAQTHDGVGREQSGLTSLQRKREYWKLMKRQQRARLKALQRERPGHSSRQAPGLVMVNTVMGVSPQANPAVQPTPSITPLTAASISPAVQIHDVSPTSCDADQSADSLQVRLPVTSVSCSAGSEQNSINAGPSQMVSNCGAAAENQQQALPAAQKWMSGNTEMDSAPSLPTLTPPDNPLSSINLQPIEPPSRTPPSNISPIRTPCSQLGSPTHTVQTLSKLTPVTSMVPPKPVPGESEEDFLRRKREYWRIKKKEQRARKAIQDKAVTSRRASNNWRPILPAQDLPTQDAGPWLSSSDESDHLMSSSVETDPASFPYSHYSEPVEDESELLFTDYENNNSEEGPVSVTVWRNHYLMDYDPLNQLLVCMVCGELQYSHSLEGVRTHIEEAHPDTLTLEPTERRRILEAWDEQVSQRERFFTSQLQQHGGSLAEAHRD